MFLGGEKRVSQILIFLELLSSNKECRHLSAGTLRPWFCVQFWSRLVVYCIVPKSFCKFLNVYAYIIIKKIPTEGERDAG